MKLYKSIIIFFVLVFVSFEYVSAHESRLGNDRVPNVDDVYNFLGNFVMKFSPDASEELVADRIMSGFEAGPSRLDTSDGVTVFWGFKYKEATSQSVVIYGANGDVGLIAAPQNIVAIRGSFADPVTTLVDYENLIMKMGREPLVSVFVHTQEDLNAYYPILLRWIQADLLGFNFDCSPRSVQIYCDLSEDIRIPAVAYQVDVENNRLMSINIPNIRPVAIPMDEFRQ